MGSSPPANPAFLDAFRRRADADGIMTFATFMDLALYAPQVGYYRQPRTRVGYGPDTDFYTASSSRGVFGELVAAACLARLGAVDPKEYIFVEIGAEPGGGVLAGVDHPFGQAREIRLGEPLEFKGRCVVFSNELFDAQPLRRFVRRSSAWRELGVTIREHRLQEIELGVVEEPWLPPTAPEGYRFDAPREAVGLVSRIAAEPFEGIFVAFDYGKSYTELADHTPIGTARAYRKHTQSNALLDCPGEQDLTGHVCWDWMAGALREAGFTDAAVESQESFFVQHASDWLTRTLQEEATRLSPRKLAIMQLLHPAKLGQAFQVLHAQRGPRRAQPNRIPTSPS